MRGGGVLVFGLSGGWRDRPGCGMWTSRPRETSVQTGLAESSWRCIGLRISLAGEKKADDGFLGLVVFCCHYNTCYRVSREMSNIDGNCLEFARRIAAPSASGPTSVTTLPWLSPTIQDTSFGKPSGSGGPRAIACRSARGLVTVVNIMQG
jgi:hypothetical protein